MQSESESVLQERSSKSHTAGDLPVASTTQGSKSKPEGQLTLNAYLHAQPAVFEELIFSDCDPRTERENGVVKNLLDFEQAMKADR